MLCYQGHGHKKYNHIVSRQPQSIGWLHPYANNYMQLSEYSDKSDTVLSATY